MHLERRNRVARLATQTSNLLEDVAQVLRDEEADKENGNGNHYHATTATMLLAYVVADLKDAIEKLNDVTNV